MDVHDLYTSVLFILVHVQHICSYPLEQPIISQSYIKVHVYKRRAKFWEPWQLNSRICPPSLCKQSDETGRGTSRPRGTGGSVFFQGDIVLDRFSEKYIYKESYTKPKRRSKRATLRKKTRLWKKALVPYVIDKNISPLSKKWIVKAFKHIQQHTCIRFQKKRNKHKNFILYKSEPGCWSNVGMQGGMQVISIGRGCEHLGTAVHETVHALGVWHEQARADRNKFVKIIKENISPRYILDFKIIDRNISSARGYPYDYNSIMHYSQYAFTRNGEPTIQVIGVGKERKLTIGQRDGLSTIDIAQLREMYQCNQKEDTKATVCPKSWVKNKASCYKFFDHPKEQFSAAHKKCNDLHSDLLNINNLKEQEFIEAHSLKEYKDVYIWRTGGRKINGTFKWYRGENQKAKKVSYTNWDTNQPQSFTSIALGRDKNTNRFTWRGVWTGSVSQLPHYIYSFICEKRAKRKCLPLKHKDGRDYRGSLDHTVEGSTCQKWSSQYPHKHRSRPGHTDKDDEEGLGDHNYCRNPSDQRRKRPWCYTAKRGVKWQYCDVTVCSKKKTYLKQKPTKGKYKNRISQKKTQNRKHKYRHKKVKHQKNRRRKKKLI